MTQQLLFKTNPIFFWSNQLDPKRKTILLVHPAFCDHEIFKYQVEYFSPQFNVITVDMIGHGLSKVANNDVTIADMPEILKAILDELSIKSVTILGVSLGSVVAQSFAYKFPDMIDNVIVVGGYPIQRALNQDIMKAQGAEIRKWIPYLIFSIGKFRQYVTKQSVMSEKGQELFLKGAQHFTLKSFMAMRNNEKLLIDENEIHPKPFYFIYGEYDLKLAKNSGKMMAINFLRTYYSEIKEAGHCANVDNPELFNHEVEEILNKKFNKLKRIKK